MPGPVSLYRRFIVSTRGPRPSNLTMILPVLVIMLLATFDAGRGDCRLHESANGNFYPGCHYQPIFDNLRQSNLRT